MKTNLKTAKIQAFLDEMLSANAIDRVFKPYKLEEMEEQAIEAALDLQDLPAEDALRMPREAYEYVMIVEDSYSEFDTREYDKSVLKLVEELEHEAYEYSWEKA